MPKFAANLTMLFQEEEFLDRFAAAKSAGFAGVEYLFPYAFEKEALAEQLASNGLSQVLHNFPAGDWDAGERGIAILKERQGEFQDSVGSAIDYAKALGCGQLNCLAGIYPDGADPDSLTETFVENLRFASEKLAAENIKLLIEPINTRDIPKFFLNNTQQALDIIETAAVSNLWLQYDIYHMQIMEGDLAPTIEAQLGRIAHMQLADTPGRHEPGTGEINYPFLFDFIDKAGYGGWIGCEYIPAAGTLSGLGWYASYAAG